MTEKIEKKRLAVIAARGGSKRIPRKNIKSFLGKPIILRVLDEVSASNLFEEIHVSTEDDEIAEVVSRAGHPPRFRRDHTLAGDEVPMCEVLKAVVTQYQRLGESFDTIALVFATAVLIDHHLFKHAVKEFEAGDPAIQMLSVSKYPAPLEKAMSMKSDHHLTPIYHDSARLSSKYLPDVWYETGDFVFYDERGAIQNNPDSLKRGFPLPQWLSVDIDTHEHWDLAERIYKMKKGLSYKR